MALPDFVSIEAASERRDGRISYREFGAPCNVSPTPPCFTFGTLPGYLAPDLYSETAIGGVGCYRLREAQLIFDGILLQGGEALFSLALNHPRPHVQSVLSTQAAGWASLPVRRIEGQAAVIHGPGFNIFGHWLIDFLPRLWGLQQAGIDIAALKLALPANSPEFVRRFLRLIGIPDENLVWHDQRAERLAADEWVVPTLLRLRSRFHPLFVSATNFWVDRLAAELAPSRTTRAGRRLFISRARLAGARALRERGDIEACAAAAGYEMVFPETLSLPQQISLFRSATHIVGEYGSGLHGCIFAPPDTVLCALRGTSHHPGFAQSGLAERFGHRLGYVFGPSPEHAGDHEFSIEMGAFKHALAAMDALGGQDASALQED